MIAFFVALILLTIAFVWFSMSMKSWLITATIVMGAGLLTGMTNWFLSLVAMLVIVPLLIGLFYAPNLRRKYLTGPLYKMVKGAMPPISQTEQDAIDAGTVWWDAELFAGKPDWSKLMTLPKPMLNQEERAFIEGPVEELCEMSDDWDISHVRNDLPEEVWQYISRSNDFLG